MTKVGEKLKFCINNRIKRNFDVIKIIRNEYIKN